MNGRSQVEIDGWSEDDDENDAQNVENGAADEDTPDDDGVSHESDDEAGDDDNNDAESKNKRGARSYRKRAQAAEAEVTKLRATVEGMQRREVERVVGAKMADPSDLWRYDGGELAQFIDADGELDREALTAHVDALLTNRPHLAKNSFKRRPLPDRSQGSHGGGAPTETTWGDVLSA